MFKFPALLLIFPPYRGDVYTYLNPVHAVHRRGLVCVLRHIVFKCWKILDTLCLKLYMNSININVNVLFSITFFK